MIAGFSHGSALVWGSRPRARPPDTSSPARGPRVTGQPTRIGAPDPPAWRPRPIQQGVLEACRLMDGTLQTITCEACRVTRYDAPTSTRQHLNAAGCAISVANIEEHAPRGKTERQHWSLWAASVDLDLADGNGWHYSREADFLAAMSSKTYRARGVKLHMGNSRGHPHPTRTA